MEESANVNGHLLFEENGRTKMADQEHVMSGNPDPQNWNLGETLEPERNNNTTGPHTPQDERCDSTVGTIGAQ